MSDDILDEHIDRLDQQAETIATLEADNNDEESIRQVTKALEERGWEECL
ncbi:hypothetical protein LCGC14_1030610 [marine sediment metagenome]|uniref:Uncharacterized protein n=1 Tax=marine sediment metagenome TaxID=412755 RepID=A0A0F9NGG0_9ZZZZ